VLMIFSERLTKKYDNFNLRGNKMKYSIVILLAVVLLVAGCVTASYNPKTNEIKYSRLGDQKVSGFTAELPDGSKVAFEQQESNAQMLQSALQLLEKGMEIGASQ